MSRRGGGRRSETRRDQESSTPSPSFQRGRGRGGDRGRGRGGRGGFTPAPSPTPVHAPPPAASGYRSAIAGPSTVSTPQAAHSSATAPPPPAYATAAATATATASSSSSAIVPPPRPGYGKLGKKCVIRANHFAVEVSDRDLFHYDVAITPEITSKKVNRDVISQLVRSFRESYLGNRMPAYDGRKSLFTAGALPFEAKEFVVKLVEKDDPASSSSSVK
ncbi:unnamed protein product [Dovyalis caffra]|uniref:Protein argonaute N-terminal domain-containing protein n=1 Tax=Dovyalis caffra TaxID=77055 RepID=A0AAV1RBX8_9ROSI|nr:unnamed protein product [Dovyalis caffra]